MKTSIKIAIAIIMAANTANACETHFWLVRWARKHHKHLGDEAAFLATHPGLAEKLDHKCMKARKHPKPHENPTPTPTPPPTPTPRPTASPTPAPTSTPTPTPGCVMGPICWAMNQQNWCADTLELGSITYDRAQIVTILNFQFERSNGLVALGRELASAKIAAACNADTTCIASTIVAADMLIGNKVIPPVGNGFLPISAVSNLVVALHEYNQGQLCAPMCQEDHPQ